MNLEILPKLIFPDSKLDLSYECKEQLNKTTTAFLIEGNQNGFLSLANVFLFLSNELEKEILLHRLPFIKTSIEVRIKIDNKTEDTNGKITALTENSFLWSISETEFNQFCASVHALGYCTDHIHFDENKEADDISIYCGTIQ